MIDREINEELINEIIEQFQTDEVFYYNSNDGDIIPIELKHSHIIRNKQHNKIIYDNYCADGIPPYSMVIYGAYYRRDYLINNLRRLLPPRYYINDKKIKCFRDLEPYFKDYAEGFKLGFNEFENDIITPYLVPLADKHDTINKVFEYVAKRPWWTQRQSFTFTASNLKSGKREIVDVFDDGKEQGYLYKAWSIILANQNHFIPLFNNLAQDAEQPREPQQPEAPKYRISTKHYVMADIFERNATGRGLPTGKNEREAAGIARAKKCTKQTCAPNTFYDNYNMFDYKGIDINKESDLINYFGEGWREILLYITIEPEKVKEYLQKHQI